MALLLPVLAALSVSATPHRVSQGQGPKNPLLAQLGQVANAAKQADAAQPQALVTFRNKVVVVAGADGAIGQALVAQLLAEQATVFAGVHNERPSAELVALAEAFPQTLHLLQLDVSERASVQLFARQVTASHVDVLFNNAGIAIDDDCGIVDLPEGRIQATFNVNTTGPVRMTQAFYTLLRRAKRPVIVNISSLLGSIGDNTVAGSAAYRMSKAALNMFGKTLAIEQPSLLVLSLHPGWVKTQNGSHRLLRDPKASAAGILQLVAAATPAQSGHFFRYSGEVTPW